MKNSTFLKKAALFATLGLLFFDCKNSTQPAAPPAEATTTPKPVPLQTHAEASDTLLADSTQPLKPLRYIALSPTALKTVLDSLDMNELLTSMYPDNGFYGADRYRIEFIFMGAERDPADPMRYRVTGKNRYKKTVSNFGGTLQIKQIREFRDPNMDADETKELGFTGKLYALEGDFAFDEDRSLSTSGQFAGKFQLEMSSETVDSPPSLWYFSDQSPARGSGYRFDGTWTSYTKPDMKKPVIWSRDLFRFANDILTDFSYGERDVVINEKYRALGWDNFWDGEEWWQDTPKSEEHQAK
jgi:hypothetical protein